MEDYTIRNTGLPRYKFDGSSLHQTFTIKLGTKLFKHEYDEFRESYLNRSVRNKVEQITSERKVSLKARK